LKPPDNLFRVIGYISQYDHNTMTVYTHPKDQGPIDTADKEVCSNCRTTLRVKGDKIWLDSTRKQDRTKKNTHINVCPNCKESVKYHNVDTVRHIDCRSTFTQMDMDLVSRNPKKWACPCCNDELTDENTKIYE